MFLKVILVRNCHILFKIGEMASDLNLAEYFSNSESKNSLTCWFVMLAMVVILDSLSVKKLGISSKVLVGISKRAMIEFLKICFSLGPQNSGQTFLRTEIRLEATKW